MTTKVLLVDLDGTIRETASGKTFINEPTDQKPIEGVQEAIEHLSEKFVIIGVTNQGGVAAGHKSLASAIEEQRITLDLFPHISEIFFCPNWGDSCYQVSRGNEPIEFSAPLSGDGTKISCRKPGYGMLLLASRSLAEPKDCIMIGDQPEDKTAAETCGIKFFWASVLRKEQEWRNLK
jgi:D-glycero-D-manno-heptose 1,7-bisphosphate phosphatase